MFWSDVRKTATKGEDGVWMLNSQLNTAGEESADEAEEGCETKSNVSRSNGFTATLEGKASETGVESLEARP